MPSLLNEPFYAPSSTFYTGASALSSLVPDTFPIALNGRPYMVDFDQPFYRQYRRQLAQLIRTQADTSTEPGDQTMDPNSLWRRSYEDWTLGAGQRYLDRPAVNGSASSTGSVPNAFWQSKGVDALTTKWQITLLPDTTQLKASTNTNLQVVTVGSHIYVIDGQVLAYASSLGGSWTTVTGTPAVTASSIATDGYNVYVAYGTDGVYTTTEGASSASQLVTSSLGSSAIVGYANGRLMLADGDKIYNITSYTSAALPTALFTAGNPNTTFTNFTSGVGAIYVGAAVGNQSFIYGMTMTTDGTALSAPVIQGALPTGETVYSVYGYLNFLIVGSDQGVRMCQTSSSGAVTLGSLISTPAAVKCMAGWGRFVYFGYTTYDWMSSGVGKLDLENQVISGVLPAYCSDLMVTTQDAVTSMAVYSGDAIFVVDGVGLYGPDSTQLVSSGYIDSGYVMYDLTDLKLATLLDVQSLGPTFYGSFNAELSTDGGTFAGIGTAVEGDTNVLHTWSCGPASGQRFEVRLTLTRDTTTLTEGPTITRWTLRSYPTPARPLTWQLPIILDESVINASSDTEGFDPLVELQALEAMATSPKQMVTFQEGLESYPVFVQDVEFLPIYPTENRANRYYNGLALVTLVGLPVQV